MLAQIISHNSISCQLLQLFGVVKTSNVTNLRVKATDRYQSMPTVYLYTESLSVFLPFSETVPSALTHIHPYHPASFPIPSAPFWCFFTPHAVLRGCYQGFCPFHPGSSASHPPKSNPHLPPQLYDVLRQQCRFQDHLSADYFQILINVFVFRA